MSQDRGFVSQPWSQGAYQLFDAHDFRNAVSAHMAGDLDAAFCLVLIRPDRPGLSSRLGTLVLNAICLEAGDLAARLDESVAIYLHGDVGQRFVECVAGLRTAWRDETGGTLSIAAASYPREEDRVIELLSEEWRTPTRRTVRPEPAPHPVSDGPRDEAPRH